MIDRLNETIVAISSAPGVGPVGIVRLTGPAAISLVDQFARTTRHEPLSTHQASTRVCGEILFDSDLALPAVFYVFRSPHSYTRQDLVEIHTIGSPPALELLKRRAIALGATPAQPGEFTARAFLNGAMDLTKAEAVAGLIRAQSDTQLRAARRLMDGALSRQIVEMRDTLAELVALVEADIDFAEEPIEFITPRLLRDRLVEITAALHKLRTDAPSKERLDRLPRILLLGPPNSGKSSLMNRLSGTSRAICAAAAGTTRDILSAPVDLGCGEAVLLDAAGVDASPDEIITAAREMTLATAERVDLVCLVVDLSDMKADELRDVARSLDIAKFVVVLNKSDLVSDHISSEAKKRCSAWNLGPACLTSAQRGTGIDALRQMLADQLADLTTTTTGEVICLSERQRTALRDAADALQRAVKLTESAAETIDCADLLAFELRDALDFLGTITGQVTTEDLLTQVFANFCIGK